MGGNARGRTSSSLSLSRVFFFFNLCSRAAFSFVLFFYESRKFSVMVVLSSVRCTVVCHFLSLTHSLILRLFNIQITIRAFFFFFSPPPPPPFSPMAGVGRALVRLPPLGLGVVWFFFFLPSRRLHFQAALAFLNKRKIKGGF